MREKSRAFICAWEVFQLLERIWRNLDYFEFFQRLQVFVDRNWILCSLTKPNKYDFQTTQQSVVHLSSTEYMVAFSNAVLDFFDFQAAKSI